MHSMSKFIMTLFVSAHLMSNASFAEEKAKDQLKRAPKQTGEVTFDGAKSTTTYEVKGSSTTRTPEQAIKDYKDSSKTTEREQKAIEAYKNSGKSRSGK